MLLGLLVSASRSVVLLCNFLYNYRAFYENVLNRTLFQEELLWVKRISFFRIHLIKLLYFPAVTVELEFPVIIVDQMVIPITETINLIGKNV